MNNQIEYIICAAIHYPDIPVKLKHNPNNIQTGVVLCGRRHHNIIELASISIPRLLTLTSIQGFITSHNRFVDRIEALNIAKQADQIVDTGQIKGSQLYSEDLY